ncbi:bola domain protein [Dipodascopsis tothii]|uniref:bola domain protein n=1 Tax=Dipodascopsis tothii TaxID=44089 RepID=UPI0034CE8FE2
MILNYHHSLRYSIKTWRSIRTMSSSRTPIEDLIRSRISVALNPSHLVIKNDSHKHAHHAPMIGSDNVKESHFRLEIVSEAFKGKMMPARHRLIYALMKDEMAAPNMIHALQLKTLTPEEFQKKSTSV